MSNYQLQVLENGSAKLIDPNTTTQQHNNTTTQQHTLDSLLAESGFVPNFIKIDTDGFDFKILRGAYQTLKDHKPVLFFEWNYVHLANQSEVTLSIFAFLSNLGYDKLVIFDNYGHLLCTLSTQDTFNLSILMDYTRYKQRCIPYYDVLALHKESLFDIKEYRKTYWSNPHFYEKHPDLLSI
ncbi:FkbM family methyltransferase [Helicobacter suis]|uniref:FkbM family methyltransferase n=1 Tax=Helicobacter suis TaxID=104628 RepID=UPI001F085C14|nr:FkbM family methyltransferase [Helicobacter suis]